jgi:hypothetical protein
MQKMVRLLGVIAVSLSLASCGGVASPSSYPPDDFTGNIAPGGQASRAFTVSKTGEMQVTLTALSPAPRVGFLAVGVGQYVGNTCQPSPSFYSTQTPVGQALSFGTIPEGSYCIVVLDVNLALTATATFTVEMLHP